MSFTSKSTGETRGNSCRNKKVNNIGLFDRSTSFSIDEYEKQCLAHVHFRTARYYKGLVRAKIPAKRNDRSTHEEDPELHFTFSQVCYYYTPRL